MTPKAPEPAEIENRLAEYFEARTGVILAYLFGSYAEGREHRESDVDVAVLLDRSVHFLASDRFDERVRIASDLISVLHCNELDLVVLNDAPAPFARRIVLDGRRVFCADVDEERRYRRDVQLRAADIEPFIERMRCVKLEAMAR